MYNERPEYFFPFSIYKCLSLEECLGFACKRVYAYTHKNPAPPTNSFHLQLCSEVEMLACANTDSNH